MAVNLFFGLFVGGFIGALILAVVHLVVKDYAWRNYALVMTLGLIVGGLFIDSLYEISYMEELKTAEENLETCQENMATINQRYCVLQNKTLDGFTSTNTGIITACR